MLQPLMGRSAWSHQGCTIVTISLKTISVREVLAKFGGICTKTMDTGVSSSHVSKSKLHTHLKLGVHEFRLAIYLHKNNFGPTK